MANDETTGAIERTDRGEDEPYVILRQKYYGLLEDHGDLHDSYDRMEDELSALEGKYDALVDMIETFVTDLRELGAL